MKAVKEAVSYEIGDVIYVDKRYALVAVLYAYNCEANCEKCEETCMPTTKTYRVYNGLNAKVGERVMLSLTSRMAFWRSVALLALPCLLFIPLFSFTDFFLTNLWHVFIGVVFFLFSLIFLRTTDHIMQKTKKYEIAMVKIIKTQKKTKK